MSYDAIIFDSEGRSPSDMEERSSSGSRPKLGDNRAWPGDSDGVFVELSSRDVLTGVMKQTFSGFDYSLGREEKLEILTGNTTRIRTLCQRHRLDTVDVCTKTAKHIVQEQKREFEEGLRSLYDDVTAVLSIELPFGLVSDNLQAIVEYIVERFNLKSQFEAIYSCSFTPTGLSRMKPDPYYLNAALSSIGTQNALYVGDSACDVAAADNAGIDSVLISRGDEDSGKVRNETMEEAEPWTDYEISSLRELPALVG